MSKKNRIIASFRDKLASLFYANLWETTKNRFPVGPEFICLCIHCQREKLSDLEGAKCIWFLVVQAGQVNISSLE